MAGEIKVNTELVAKAAAGISYCNGVIKTEFASVDSAIQALNNAWDGNAATHAASSFGSIKNAYFEARFTVMNNYINFLNQVDSGYTQTETVNTSLADVFK